MKSKDLILAILKRPYKEWKVSYNNYSNSLYTSYIYHHADSGFKIAFGPNGKMFLSVGNTSVKFGWWDTLVLRWKILKFIVVHQESLIKKQQDSAIEQLKRFIENNA